MGSPGKPGRGWEAKVMGRPGAQSHINAISALISCTQLALCTTGFCPWYLSGMLMTAVSVGRKIEVNHTDSGARQPRFTLPFFHLLAV